MMAVQGSPLRWVAIQRRHHQHSDTPDDPHSPHHHGSGVLGVLRGFWHAYIGWFFDPDPPELDNYVKDLNKIQALWITDTLWRGIPLDTHFTDTTGRPVPLLPEGQPIRELP